MKKISLESYGPIISDKEVGSKIYQIIKNELSSDQIELDLKGVQSMATFCAKQVFGNLYLELGPSDFFEKIRISNANDDIRTIIKIGIQHAVSND
jgi:hypothetical protein